MMPPHGSRPRPLPAGCEFPAPTPARRPPTPGLQPSLDVASAHARPVQRHRPNGVGALPEPDPGHQRADRLVAPARRPTLPGRVPRRPGRLRQLHGQRRRALVPASLRRGARGSDRLLLRRIRPPRVARDLLGRPRGPRRRPHEDRQRHGPAGRSASGCSTARATSARRSTPTATRSTTTPTTT